MRVPCRNMLRKHYTTLREDLHVAVKNAVSTESVVVRPQFQAELPKRIPINPSNDLKQETHDHLQVQSAPLARLQHLTRAEGLDSRLSSLACMDQIMRYSSCKQLNSTHT